MQTRIWIKLAVALSSEIFRQNQDDHLDQAAPTESRTHTHRIQVSDRDILFALDGTTIKNKNWQQGVDYTERGQAFGRKSKEQISSGMAWLGLALQERIFHRTLGNSIEKYDQPKRPHLTVVK